MVLPFDRRSGWSLQERVEHLIRDAVAAGELVEGDQLPPYRGAAATSAVSINTILNAYRVLIADGVVRSAPGYGYFIAGPVRYRDFFSPSTAPI